jgi:PAS domain S-box-containing protein
MSPIFWLDCAAYGISAVIATALTLIVMGAGPRRTLNRFFALFTLAEATWAALALLLRMTLWLGVGNSALALEMSTLAFVLMGPFLLLFTVRYVGRRTRWADLGAVIELVATVVLSVPLFHHQLIFNPRLDANGTTLFDVSAWGVVATVLPALCFVWSLVLFWQERRRTGEPYLALSVLILLIGLVAGGIVQPRFPIMSITTTFSVAMLGYGVVSRQIFNPLRELTEELRQEITERKRAEEALRESEQEYRRLFATAQRQTRDLSLLDQVRTALASELDLSVVFRTTVEAIAETFGYTLVSLYLLQDDVLVLQHQIGYDQVIEQVPITQGIMGRVARTGEPTLLKDTSTDPTFLEAIEGIVSEVCVPLFDQDRVVGVLNVESTEGVALGEADLRIATALSEHVNIAIGRARLYTTVRGSEDRYRTLVIQAPIGVVTCDREGNITHANPALLQILGSPGEEATRQFNVLTMPNMVEAGVAADFRRCMEEATRITAEYHYRSYWGKESILRIRLTPLRIINYAQLLLNKAEPDSRQARFLDGILREGERVASIIRDLLTFARVEKETHSLAHVPDILRATLTLADQQLRKDSIILEIKEQPDLPQIKCRSQRIQQVFLNLTSNARHALNARYQKDDPNKRLTIRIEAVEKEGQPYVRTTFHDQGVGIPAQNLPHVFTPFFTTKKPDEGTGLGLSVSYGIVQDHHGDIQMESVEDEYTIFRVDLPVDNKWEL